MVGYTKQLVTELQVVDEYHDVPAADNVLNAQTNEVIGNKNDAAATGAVTATDTLVGYLKQIVTMLGPTELDTDTLGEILVGTAGITAFPAAAAPANSVSLAEVMREIFDQVDKSLSTAAGVMPNGTTTIFTVAGGPIEVLELLSVCVTVNDATASTLQYQADPTNGAATALSLASGSLASLAAGNTALCTGTFGAAPTVTLNGTVAAGTTKFIVPAGVIQSVIAVGATSGTWTHHLRYAPLSRGVTVT
mgnify:FL=1